MIKRKCKNSNCGKVLERKKWKNKRAKKHWSWESPCYFKIRQFCNRSCKSSYTNIALHKKLGHIIWNKDKIKKEFNKIKTDKKYKLNYLQKKHIPLGGAIQIYYVKNAWYHFLKDIGKLDKLRRNNICSKKSRLGKAKLKYLIHELGTDDKEGWPRPLKIGDRFKYSFSGWDEFEALNYLKEKKAIRCIKRGKLGRKAFTKEEKEIAKMNSGSKRCGLIEFKGGQITEYILLKSRI